MKQIFILTILLAFNLIAQDEFPSGPEAIIPGNFYRAEIHTIPSGEAYSTYYIYKIPYSQLFFEKVNDKFTAGMRVNIEVLDSDGNAFKREFDEKIITTNYYESTTSEELYLQGLIKFNFEKGKYKILAVISDKISKRERKLRPIDLKIPDSEIILRPIFVKNLENKINSFDSIAISNNGYSIPFDQPDDDLIIPVIDNSIKTLKLLIKNPDKEILLEKEIQDNFLINPEIRSLDDRIVITRSKHNESIKYFYINNISAVLNEGPVVMEIIPDDDLKKKSIFNFIVSWANKPRSLIDSEKAIEYLEIIESKDKVEELLRKKEPYSKILFDYWKDLDITPETKYNELMKEFYQRVDDAEREFISITGNGGAFSDRGKIYIKYGKPFEVLRNTNGEGKVVETWFYKKPNIKFVFVDKDGTGKFLIVNQQ